MQIPIICIANDRQAQKLKPLLHTTFNLTFKKYVPAYLASIEGGIHCLLIIRPDANAIRSRIMSICFRFVVYLAKWLLSFNPILAMCREGMKIPGNVVDQLVQGAQSDIRQVINMLSTWRLSNETMDFDQGKALYVQTCSPMFPLNIDQFVMFSERK